MICFVAFVHLPQILGCLEKLWCGLPGDKLSWNNQSIEDAFLNQGTPCRYNSRVEPQLLCPQEATTHSHFLPLQRQRELKKCKCYKIDLMF